MKLFDTITVFLKEYFDNVILKKKNQQAANNHETISACTELIFGIP